jgi:ribosomal protein S18 acetylase RimI-like enzyme
MPHDHPLDRPVWSALTTRQKEFGVGDGLALRFAADVSPLAAARDASGAALAALLSLLPADDEISLLERAPPPAPPGVALSMGGLCLQMATQGIIGAAGGAAIEALGDSDGADMLALAALTRPGPFRTRTHALGRFLGVRDGARLIAMAGERMQIDGFIEISAVCTHPDYRGRGYGAALLRAVGARILAQGATPFLHSYADNATALALYRRLGFSVRAEVTHAVWRRAAATI